MEPRATRYLQHLTGLLRLHAPRPGFMSGGVTLACAAPLASLVSGQPPAEMEVPSLSPVADSFGHRRPAYRGLLLHAWARALLRGWRPRHRERLTDWYSAVGSSFDPRLPPQDIPAAQGFELCRKTWEALALCSGGVALHQDAWRAAGQSFFAALLPRLQRETFLRVRAEDNLEPWWYHELVLLHAATSYALAGRDRQWMAFIEAAANHHYRQTQPDHASTQPWGINAFLCFPATAFLADQMIHSAITQGEGQPESVAAILFADTLDALVVRSS